MDHRYVKFLPCATHTTCCAMAICMSHSSILSECIVMQSMRIVASGSGWATVCKTVALCYQTFVCPGLSCLVRLSVYMSVMLVYCGQMARWIKVPLGREVPVGLGPSDIV